MDWFLIFGDLGSRYWSSVISINRCLSVKVTKTRKIIWKCILWHFLKRKINRFRDNCILVLSGAEIYNLARGMNFSITWREQIHGEMKTRHNWLLTTNEKVFLGLRKKQSQSVVAALLIFHFRFAFWLMACCSLITTFLLRLERKKNFSP